MLPWKKIGQVATRSSILFCDTTVIYYKLHGHSLQQQAIRDLARNSRLVLSGFVVGEYIRGYVVGLLELYFAIKAESSVRDGMQVFRSDCGNRPRRLSNAFQSTADWLCGYADWEDIDKTLRRLGEYIRQCVGTVVFEFPTRTRDPLGCDIGVLAFRREAYSEDLLLDFYEEFSDIREEPQCGQCDFRSLQVEELGAAGIDLYSAGQRQRHSTCKGYVQQAEWLEKAVGSTLKAPSCWYCDRLGDSIIALSASADGPILIGDRQSFPALCAILGKQLVLIPSLEELRDRPSDKRSRKSKRRPGR